MVQAEAYRQLVVARAGGVCEYCRLVELATGVTFHIEHVVPQVLGGQTVMSNLALSCPGCNLAKANKTTGKARAVKRNRSSIRASTNRGCWVGTCILFSITNRERFCHALSSAKQPFSLSE